MKWVVWSLRAVSLAALAGAVTALGADQPTTTTYRWVDAQGVVHYSDTPQPGAEQLKIHPAQTYSAAPTSAQAANRPDAEQNTSAVYQACKVQHPTAEQSFFAPDAIPVNLNLQPTLRSDDHLSVTLDGTPLEPLEDSPLHFRIADPDRGSHTLSVTVRDASGNVVCNSPGVTFYVERPSRLSPQSPTRGGH
jgi:Domain of unknown function (DUF4124)